MDHSDVAFVLARLRPLIRDSQVRRSRLERVLAIGTVPVDTLRPAVEDHLTLSGITILEDTEATPTATLTGPVPAPVDTGPPEVAATGAEPFLPAPETAQVIADRDAAVDAARRLLRRDAHTAPRTRHKRLLNAELEVGLALLMRGGPEAAPGDVVFGELVGEARAAAEALFLHNQRLVHKMAQRYPAIGMEYEDLAQFGYLGLMRAVEKYDPTMGYKFSTYATWWIRQSLTRGIADHARLIRLPAHMVETVNKVWTTRDRLTLDGRPPTVHALAQATKLSDRKVVEALRLGRTDPFSLDAPAGAEGETTLGELLELEDPRGSAVQEMEHQELIRQIHAVLDTLTEREASVVSMRFGLTDGEEKTLEEIGKIYGVTRERIRQIQDRALANLRHPSRSQVLRDWI